MYSTLYHYQSIPIPYPKVLTLFISLNMFCTVHAYRKFACFFIVFSYCVIATKGSATMHCHCFLRVINEASNCACFNVYRFVAVFLFLVWWCAFFVLNVALVSQK